VSGCDGELGGVCSYRFVLGRRQVDPVNAVGVGALADELDRSSVCGGEAGGVLEKLVDPSEGRLVDACAMFRFGHDGE
jgi:hypothetical protein